MLAPCPPNYEECTRKCCYEDGSGSTVISDCDDPCGCYPGSQGVTIDGALICSGGRWVAVININAAKDDNFQATINGTAVGLLDFNSNVKRGYLIMSYTTEGADSVKALFDSSIVWQAVYTSSVEVEGTFCMSNVQQNYNGNYGTVTWGNITDGVIGETTYSMGNGGSQCFNISTSG